jgi:hypothetical protein
MDLSGDSPLPNPRSLFPGDVARLALTLAAVLGCVSQVQAQQYTYYYPTARSSQPTYYYPQQTYRQQGNTYARQYYQVPAPTQYYQTPAAPQYYQAPTATQTTQTDGAGQKTLEGAQVVPASYSVPTAEAPAEQPAQAAPAASSAGDPYGFLSWLNSVRASYGLGAVGYDANLSNWASMNNSQQMAYGLGHFVMGPARRQNSAAGAAFPGAMWMASPAHRAALLDPTISWIGIAAAGAYWTFNAY